MTVDFPPNSSMCKFIEAQKIGLNHRAVGVGGGSQGAPQSENWCTFCAALQKNQDINIRSEHVIPFTLENVIWWLTRPQSSQLQFVPCSILIMFRFNKQFSFSCSLHLTNIQNPLLATQPIPTVLGQRNGRVNKYDKYAVHYRDIETSTVIFKPKDHSET